VQPTQRTAEGKIFFVKKQLLKSVYDDDRVDRLQLVDDAQGDDQSAIRNAFGLTTSPLQVEDISFSHCWETTMSRAYLPTPSEKPGGKWNGGLFAITTDLAASSQA
jgi:hypothetical protein